MVIAVENGLEDVSSRLASRGHTIVSYPEYAGVVDAFIYNESILNTNAYQDGNVNQSLENYTSSSQQGVLIINARNKSIAQIEEILMTRTYSKLF